MSARHPYLSKMANIVGQRIVHNKKKKEMAQDGYCISSCSPCKSRLIVKRPNPYTSYIVLHVARQEFLELSSASCKNKRAANYKHGNKMEGW